MLIPESPFENLLANHGNVSISQISQGSRSQNYIRGLLANKSDSDPDFPRLIKGDFLSGSYARGTKIYPLDDIDVMLVIDGAGLFPIKNGQRWNAAIRESNKTDNPLLKQLEWDGLLSSRNILDHFKSALEQSHPSSKIAKDGQAINVQLSSGIGVDIVPCFHIIPHDGSQDVYYIPVGHGSNGWMITNPKIDERISKALHDYHNEKLRPIIKLLKLWNVIFNANRLRSYHLETVAWYIFDKYPGKINHYGSALIYFFNTASSWFKINCPDITQLGGPIDLYLTQENRFLTLQRIGETQKILNETYVLGLADEPRQMSGWRKIYGNRFGIN